MSEFIAIVLGFPTIVFTIGLVLAVLYWLLVIVGAVDLDGLFEGAAEGAAEAAAEGAAEALGEAAAEAVAEGAVEGAVAGGSATGGGLTGLLSALSLRHAPATVVGSVLVAAGFVLSFVGSRYLAPLVPGPIWVGGIVVLLVALVLALPIASVVTRPLGQLFQIQAAKRRRDFVGQVCVVSTGRVDEGFGQAQLEDGGAGLILAVRAEPGKLGRGDRALIIGYDEQREAYLVEPLDPMLGNKE